MQVSLPSTTVRAGRHTFGPASVSLDWSHVSFTLDCSALTVFPLWIEAELSRDGGTTWEQLIRFDVTGFASLDKLGQPAGKVVDFRRTAPKSSYKSGALVRVHVDNPVAFVHGGGTLTVDDSGPVIPFHSSIALVSGQALAVDTGAAAGTTLATGNFASAVTAGNLIACNSGNDSAGGVTVSSVTDTLTNAYTANQASANNATAAQRIDAHYAKNIAGGTNSVTINYSGSVAFRHAHASEYSGANTTAPLDQSTGATGNGTPTSGNVTTTTDGQLIYGAEGNASTGVGAGFTALGAGANYNNRSEYQIQTSAGAIAATFTGSGQYCVVIMTFKAAAAPGVNAPTTRSRFPEPATRSRRGRGLKSWLTPQSWW